MWAGHFIHRHFWFVKCYPGQSQNWSRGMVEPYLVFFPPAVTSGRSRVFGETIIFVIFAGAVGMWPSHLIDWSPERLTAHSVQSNSYSYCRLHFQKNTVRTQKRSHMLEEMEPERPLVWSCLLVTWMATSYFARPEMLHWSRSNLEMDLAADLQESQRMAPNNCI